LGRGSNLKFETNVLIKRVFIPVDYKIKNKRKLFVYVDESGQDTKGKFFVVSVVIIEANKDLVIKKLEEIEQNTKKSRKWTKTKPAFREKYIDRIARSGFLKESIFFYTFDHGKEYMKFTSITTGKAILTKVKNDKNYTSAIYIDGSSKNDIRKFKKEIKYLGIHKKKVRGVRKEQSNVLILLADAICGLVRESKKKLWAKDSLKKIEDNGIIRRL
jgi:hypothetical protein